MLENGDLYQYNPHPNVAHLAMKQLVRRSRMILSSGDFCDRLGREAWSCNLSGLTWLMRSGGGGGGATGGFFRRIGGEGY